MIELEEKLYKVFFVMKELYPNQEEAFQNNVYSIIKFVTKKRIYEYEKLQEKGILDQAEAVKKEILDLLLEDGYSLEERAVMLNLLCPEDTENCAKGLNYLGGNFFPMLDRLGKVEDAQAVLAALQNTLEAVKTKTKKEIQRIAKPAAAAAAEAAAKAAAAEAEEAAVAAVAEITKTVEAAKKAVEEITKAVEEITKAVAEITKAVEETTEETTEEAEAAVEAAKAAVEAAKPAAKAATKAAATAATAKEAAATAKAAAATAKAATKAATAATAKEAAATAKAATKAAKAAKKAAEAATKAVEAEEAVAEVAVYIKRLSLDNKEDRKLFVKIIKGKSAIAEKKLAAATKAVEAEEAEAVIEDPAMEDSLNSTTLTTIKKRKANRLSINGIAAGLGTFKRHLKRGIRRRRTTLQQVGSSDVDLGKFATAANRGVPNPGRKGNKRKSKNVSTGKKSSGVSTTGAGSSGGAITLPKGTPPPPPTMPSL